MNVLSLPVELIEGCILPLLGWNDLLRLRRTSKEANYLVKDYIRRHPDKAPELEIGKKTISLPAFVEMGICTRKIRTNLFYSNTRAASSFFTNFAPKVTHLHVSKFSLYCTDKERQFLEGFVNLKSLTLDKVIARPEEPMVPNVFRQLRELRMTWMNSENYSEQVVKQVVMNLPKLESIEVAFYSPDFSERENTRLLEANIIRTYISFVEQKNAANGKLSSLKTIDLRTIYERIEPQLIYQLCKVCAEKDVQLSNVDGAWFRGDQFEGLPENQRMQLGLPVVSLMTSDTTKFITSLYFLNLEEFRALGYYGRDDGEQEPRCNLPKLKLLHVNLSGYNGGYALCRYFFEGIRHQALTELVITLELYSKDFVPVLATCVPVSCPNLKKLMLERLSGNCRGLVNLWEGLGALEELKLIQCNHMGDAAFIGADEDNPSFLKLQKLKKLTLKGLDLMPYITDTLFSTVLSRMSLTHLNIGCDERPLTSVKYGGIKSLLTGPYAASIEKFPFQYWSLQGVSKRAFRALERKFRCKDML